MEIKNIENLEKIESKEFVSINKIFNGTSSRNSFFNNKPTIISARNNLWMRFSENFINE